MANSSPFSTVLYRRYSYIERTKPFMRSPIVKAMIEHRCVGKSYILYQLTDTIKQEEPEANIIYINKEDIAFVEIDFVCTRSGKTLYIQVAIELSNPETIAREFGNLLKIKDNYPKIVVSGEQSFEKHLQGN